MALATELPVALALIVLAVAASVALLTVPVRTTIPPSLIAAVSGLLWLDCRLFTANKPFNGEPVPGEPRPGASNALYASLPIVCAVIVLLDSATEPPTTVGTRAPTALPCTNELSGAPLLFCQLLTTASPNTMPV